MDANARSLLLGLTGLRIEGGIAGVSRCIARALDDAIRSGQLDRADRVLLLEDPRDAHPPPLRGVQRFARGSQHRFALELWLERARRRSDLLLFDHVGLARALRLPAPRRAPHAVFVHGIELDAAREGSRAGVLRSAWRILTNSRSTAARVAASFPELAERIRPVLLCIDPERVALWEREGAATPGARESAVLIVGRMSASERYKGHDELLAAWPAVLRRAPQAQLWVVGEGDDRTRLEARAAQLAVAGSVRFLGRVSDRDLGALYRRASLYAMPSRMEGFGLVYAEALWHGLPCLGSSADAAAELIEPGATGELVPYGDVPALAAALVELLADRQRLARMGEAGAREARVRFGYARFRDDLLVALGLPPLGPGEDTAPLTRARAVASEAG